MRTRDATGLVGKVVAVVTVITAIGSLLALTVTAPPAGATPPPTPGIISTYAGNVVSSSPATVIGIHTESLAVRGSTVYMAVPTEHLIRSYDATTGQQHVVAGTGGAGYAGDGGAATAAMLYNPVGVAVDGAGNIFIADTANNVVRKVTVATGVITTVAGTGTYGFSGDGGPATAALLAQPNAVAVDSAGNIDISDRSNVRIRRVSAAAGSISTVVGTGVMGSTGDGGPATAAQINDVTGLAFDGAGNLLLADRGANRVRRVVAATGTITTFAGTGAGATSGDGGPATAAGVHAPRGVVVDSANGVFIAEADGHRVRHVAAATGLISTTAGTGVSGFAGDGGPATGAKLFTPSAVGVDGGVVFVADAGNNRVRRISSPGAVITTVVGQGIVAGGGDGGPAWNAQVGRPKGIATDTKGNVFVATDADSQVRKIAPDGTITTVAGNGQPTSTGDGGPATAAGLKEPAGLAVDAAGNIYIAERSGLRVRKVSALTGLISTVVGTGDFGFGGDGGQATAALLALPSGVAVDAANNLYIADAGNHRIRFVNSTTGIITTIAGTGTPGFGGDGGLATAALLHDPYGVALDTGGKVLVADRTNNRVRRFTLGGTIATVIGNGTADSTGDGGSATAASVYAPMAVTVDQANTIYVAEGYRVRAVPASTSIIDTFAGSTRGLSGNGVPAPAAQMGVVQGLAVGSGGTVFLADNENNRVRRVDRAGPGAMFHPVAPTRVLDSRTATGGWNAPLVAGAPKSLLVANPGGPMATASAVVLNVTATNASAGSFLSVWPNGSPPPNSSNLNFGAFQTIANLVTVRVGAGGKVMFGNAVGSVDVVADLVGYYDDGSAVADLFRSVAPARILDSRGTTGGWNAPLVAGAPKDLVVRGHGGVPAAATTVVANVTATGSTAGSFLTVWPSGTTKPNASVLNFAPFQTIPNLVVMPLGTNGALSFSNAIGNVHIVVDVLGYFDPTAGGARFHALVPNRILDSRFGLGLPYGTPAPWTAHSTRSLTIAGGGVVPSDATGIVMNVTATQGTAGSFVTVFPHGLAKPTSSNLNFGPNETIPNLVMVGIGTNGQVDVANELGSVDLVSDAVGFFSST